MVIYNNVDFNSNYKFGCVISFYNRREFVSSTFDVINKSFLPKDLLFIIIDDGSTNLIDIDINHPYIFIKKQKNYGISHSLAMGWDIVNLLDIDYFINLDSDVNLSVNWLSSLFNAYNQHSQINSKLICTGFNGVNHSVKSEGNYYLTKKTIGGINVFFHKSLYPYVRKSLTEWNVLPSKIEDVVSNLDEYGVNPKLHPTYRGWDWGLMEICKSEKIDLICTKPSVVQHIGKYGISSSERFSEITLDFKNQSVPKIIHQTWVDSDIPEHLRLMQRTVIDMHSDYEYKFWTDSDIDTFLQTHYPNIFEFYHRTFLYTIQKVDFIRLLLLYHFGGVYIDLDSVCIKGVDDILKYPSTFVSTKPHNSFSKKHYPIVLNNAFIASERGNDFIKKILMWIIEYKHPFDYSDYCYLDIPYANVLKSTGPLCITDTYFDYADKSLVNIVDNEYFYGVEYDTSLNPTDRVEYAFEVSRKLNNPHFIHMHESSWFKTKKRHSTTPHRNPKHKVGDVTEIKYNAKLELKKIW